ncbi:MAG TPA: bifunctional DNA-formamidopyrimidine glycosylase/DNA-(apurinic or apyrimidinic site) lyase [Pseudolysinimonas sp.]|nr:bifunctional DNA-formamidopyrimidine glycosylase/DNA-(apurinic or apyrimidinic site) lyase [Pseudolysinimonas sp.]
MPELPEVEVVRAGLAPAVTGATVTRVHVLDVRSLRRHDGPSEDFVDLMTGAVLAEPQRRGKFLWVPLTSSDEQGLPARALVTHLGMSGQLLLRSPDAERSRLTRIVLEVEHPVHGGLRVDFVDQRIFGSMAVDRLVAPADVLTSADAPTDTDAVADAPMHTHTDAAAERIPSQVAHIARDPLDPLFNDREFLRKLAAKNTTIKRALLDQTLVSGIGNIYADESLWAARVHYDQPTHSLARPRAVLLLAEIRAVLARALAEGGTSFDAQYVNVNGASGYFAHSLNAYGQAGRPCPRCGRPIVRKTFMNRGSHFCAYCQRVRRG